MPLCRPYYIRYLPPQHQQVTKNISRLQSELLEEGDPIRLRPSLLETDQRLQVIFDTQPSRLYVFRDLLR